jgi:hypothetical protein
MYLPKHIAFLYIGNPPSNYRLHEAKKSAQKRTKNKTVQRWEVEKVERKELMNSFNSFETVYVSLDEIKQESKLSEPGERIGITYPGITELGTNREKIKKFAAAPQFAFGAYYEQNKLFLMDDIFEWSHHRISWSQIRTAKDLVDQERSKKLTT